MKRSRVKRSRVKRSRVKRTKMRGGTVPGSVMGSTGSVAQAVPAAQAEDVKTGVSFVPKNKRARLKGKSRSKTNLKKIF